MSNQPKPILCNTEKETSETADIPRQIFEHHANNIPDVSEVCSNQKTDTKNELYHCISTKTGNSYVSKEVPPDTIDKIIRKLDDNNVANEDETEHITLKKLSTLLGDIRVDFLAVLNLLNCLNNSINTQNAEIQKIKKDMCRLVNENKTLSDRLSSSVNDADKRYNNTTKNQETKFDELFERMKELESRNNIKRTNALNDSQRSHLNNSKRTVTTVTTDASNTLQTLSDGKSNGSTDSNVIYDSNMEKNNFKVVPKRTLRNSGDRFGDQSTPQDTSISRPSIRSIRQGTHDNVVKRTADTKQTRMSRLGLHNVADIDRRNIKQ